MLLGRGPNRLCERESSFLGEFLSDLTRTCLKLRVSAKLLQVPRLPPLRTTSHGISAIPDDDLVFIRSTFFYSLLELSSQVNLATKVGRDSLALHTNRTVWAFGLQMLKLHKL